MERVAKEFGFHHVGGLQIPCEEEHFEELLRVLEELRSAKTMKKKTKDFMLTMQDQCYLGNDNGVTNIGMSSFG
ncbi:hypothetical protein C4D60_Mb07t13580 [Musa balbisiana]|uniref:Uncharacterized protein n=1 Tax=Musa balbisiana TaxID=52838 RepID=A0A4S8JF18_MUSBA|nr:hypothetical protein C4D60_Mb07t13580 [Musa balbisiana]